VRVHLPRNTLPKAELHVHLEGAIQPHTLLMLAQRNGVELPGADELALRNWFTFRDFDHFLEVYITITRCLRTVEDYELIAYEFGAEMARQNVRYAEITFTPATHELRFGIPYDVYFSGLSQGRMRTYDDFGVEMRWVFDMVHVARDADLNRRAADYTVAVAIEGREDGVVALGLGGPEVEESFEVMAPWFDRARAAGLHSTPHAGEVLGPSSVWNAIHLLGAERIGHGVRAIEDPALVSYLAEHHIPLEICPTSNIRLGVFPRLEEHPLPAFHRAGVPFTINSDDPPLFNTTLNDEVQLLADPFGLDRSSIDEILLNGVRHSFLPAEQKQQLEAEFIAEMAEPQQELGYARREGPYE
jgi:aminodeoxyfutalosine deaminase